MGAGCFYIYICGRAATSSGRSVYSGSKGGSEKKKLKKMRNEAGLCDLTLLSVSNTNQVNSEFL